MGTTALNIMLPPDLYEALTEAAKKEKKSPEELSVEVLMAFVARQRKLAEGRRLLKTMPRRAAKRGRSSGRTDTARRHDDYLYGGDA